MSVWCVVDASPRPLRLLLSQLMPCLRCGEKGQSPISGHPGQEEPRVDQCCFCPEGHKPEWDWGGMSRPRVLIWGFWTDLSRSWVVPCPHTFLILSVLSFYRVQLCAHTLTFSLTLIRKHWHSVQSHCTHVHLSLNSFEMIFLLKLSL